jgi:hypothetical protein
MREAVGDGQGQWLRVLARATIQNWTSRRNEKEERRRGKYTCRNIVVACRSTVRCGQTNCSGLELPHATSSADPKASPSKIY